MGVVTVRLGTPTSTLRGPGVLNPIWAQPLPHCVVMKASDPKLPVSFPSPLRAVRASNHQQHKKLRLTRTENGRALSSWKEGVGWPFPAWVPIPGGTATIMPWETGRARAEKEMRSWYPLGTK